jgi:hypothetical protein
LSGGAVNIRIADTGSYVYIEVPSPNTRKDLVSILDVAASTVESFVFDPDRLLVENRKRAAYVRSIIVTGKMPPLSLKTASPSIVFFFF